MNVLIQPTITLFDEIAYHLFGLHRFDKWERLDVELHTTATLAWHFANWQWLLAFIYLAPKGLL